MSGDQRQRHLCMHSAVKHSYWGVSKPGSQVCTLPWASAVWQKPNFHRSKRRNDAACTIKLNQSFQFEKNWSSPKALQTPTSCNQPSHCTSFSANNAIEREKFVSIPTHSSMFWPWEPWLMSVISAKLCPFPKEQLIPKPVLERQGICFKRIFMTTQLSNTTGITTACWGKFESLSSPKQSHNSLSEKLSTAIVFALQTCRQLPSPWSNRARGTTKNPTGCVHQAGKNLQRDTWKGPVQGSVLSKLIHVLCNHKVHMNKWQSGFQNAGANEIAAFSSLLLSKAQGAKS